MNYLDPNLQTLQQRYPAVAAAVQQWLATGARPAVQRDPHGQINLRVNQTQWLYPADLAAQLSTAIDQVHRLENPQILLWIGLGLGWHLAAYLQRPHPKNRFLILIEPRVDHFVGTLMCHDIRPLLTHPNVLLLIGTPPTQLEQAFYQLFTHPELVGFVQHFGIVDLGLDRDYSAQVRGAWERLATEAVRESHAVEIDAYMGWRNVVENRALIARTPLLDALKGRCAGMPGIVVSTGPSLSLSLPALQQLQDRAVVFAVDSALRLLHERGIRPHLTGCLERQVVTTTHFRDLDTSDTVLVSSPLIHPETYAAYRGRHLLLNREHHFLPWFFPDAERHGRGMSSVSHVGLFTLAYLGCRPIYLVGQDLAYDPVTQQSHAAGYAFEEAAATWESAGHAACQAMANSGQTITTLQWWQQVARYIGYMIHEMRMECYNVIPSTHGIAIPGTTRLDPDDAWMARFPNTVGARDLVQRAATPLTGAALAQREQAIDDTMSRTDPWLRAVTQQCVTLMQQIHDFIEARPLDDPATPTTEAYQRFYRDLETATTQLMQHPFYATLLGPLVQARHNILGRRGAAVLSHDDAGADTRLAKLAIPMSWYSEILVRAELVSARLEEVTSMPLSP